MTMKKPNQRSWMMIPARIIFCPISALLLDGLLPVIPSAVKVPPVTLLVAGNVWKESNAYQETA